jgi:hypothetical protein
MLESVERLTESFWRELPRGMWFIANASLRTVAFGSHVTEEVVAIYDLPGGPVAIATLFQTKDWADRDDLATYELMLGRERVPLVFGQAFDDTLQAHGKLLFRTRFTIGEPALAAEADFRDSQSEPDLFVSQIEERLSRL